MTLIANVLVALVAALHGYFLILEMFETDRTMLSQTVLEQRAAEIVESPRRGEASVA